MKYNLNKLDAFNQFVIIKIMYMKTIWNETIHQDAINDVLRVLNPLALENFKTLMIQELIEKKALH